MVRAFLSVLFLFNLRIISSYWNENGDVLVLNDKNFQIETRKYDVLLVMFYVTWCPHCRRLYPEYEQAASQLVRQMDMPLQIAKFDCTNQYETQCVRKYAIDGYPTLRIYRYGKYRDEELNYRNRTTNEIVKTMNALKKNNRTEGYQDKMNRAINIRCYSSMILGFIGFLQTFVF